MKILYFNCTFQIHSNNSDTPNEKYEVEQIFKKYGVRCCRLSPYHPEINAIEKIWSIGKGEVARSNVSGNINDVQKKTEEAFAKIDAATWKRCIDHQMDEVYHLMEHDGIIAPQGIIIEEEDPPSQSYCDVEVD